MMRALASSAQPGAATADDLAAGRGAERRNAAFEDLRAVDDDQRRGGNTRGGVAGLSAW